LAVTNLELHRGDHDLLDYYIFGMAVNMMQRLFGQTQHAEKITARKIYQN